MLTQTEDLLVCTDVCPLDHTPKDQTNMIHDTSDPTQVLNMRNISDEVCPCSNMFRSTHMALFDIQHFPSKKTFMADVVWIHSNGKHSS